MTGPAAVHRCQETQNILHPVSYTHLKILKWIEYNFAPGSVKVTFDGRKTATITDQTGATATINCTEDGTVYLEETGCGENI